MSVKHVAIIMDGNRRWAKQRRLDASQGHDQGAKALKRTVDACIEFGITTLTVYAFSTENWQRAAEEIEALFEIFVDNLLSMNDDMKRNGIRLHTIGNVAPLPLRLKNNLYHVKKETQQGKKLNLVLAINYGARDEMCRAVNKILDDFKKKKIGQASLNESMLAKYLDTANFSDPDLVIRTASESRLSNFLLYQISYSEVYISDVLWPDFNKQELQKALDQYCKRKRKFGG